MSVLPATFLLSPNAPVMSAISPLFHYHPLSHLKSQEPLMWGIPPSTLYGWLKNKKKSYLTSFKYRCTHTCRYLETRAPDGGTVVPKPEGCISNNYLWVCPGNQQVPANTVHVMLPTGRVFSSTPSVTVAIHSILPVLVPIILSTSTLSL